MKKYHKLFIIGRSKQGQIKTTENILIGIFGKPHNTNHNKNICDKVKYEWVFELNNGQIVSIYTDKYSPKGDEEFIFSIDGNDELSTLKFIESINNIIKL
jgi:hypothetical protein